jgi:hypothetical protein
MIRELAQVDYQEWCDDHRKAVTYRSSRNGSVEVPVSPQAFAQWLAEKQAEAHLELLWAYVEDQSALPVRSTQTVQ